LAALRTVALDLTRLRSYSARVKNSSCSRRRPPNSWGLVACRFSGLTRSLGGQSRLLGELSRLLRTRTLRFHLVAQLLEVGAQLFGDFVRLFVQFALLFGGRAHFFRDLPLLLGDVAGFVEIDWSWLRHGSSLVAIVRCRGTSGKDSPCARSNSARTGMKD